jgi:pSer/pThr/pTyr-binding forkhead associated (FHA) protein
MDNQKNFVPCLRGRNGPLHGVDFWIETDDFTIGRHPESNLVLNDNTISAHHAKIVKEGDHFLLIDLESTNGTFLNKEKISRKQMRTDDIVAFDKLEFQFIYRKDVSRTIISDSDTTQSPETNKITVLPEVKHSDQSENNRMNLPSCKRITGNIIALLVAFILISGSTILTNFLTSPLKSLDIFFQVLSISLTELPLLLLPPYWVRFFLLNLTIFKFIAVPAAFILAGMILQKYFHSSRFKNALYFSHIYVGLALVIQFTIKNFNLPELKTLYSMFGYGISNSSVTFIVHLIFMGTMVLVPTYLGSFFIKKISIEEILQKKR